MTSTNQTQPRPGLPAGFYIAAAMSFLGLALAITALVALRSQPATTTSAPPPAPPLTEPSEYLAQLGVPEFTLTDQTGSETTQTIFDGQYTVLDFIFTNCPFACPGMTTEMLRVQNETKARLVSISVDPDHDTPEVLAEFADTRGADTDSWTFLTGPDQVVEDILDGLALAMAPDSDTQIPLEGGGTMTNLTHPTRLILIGPDRSVLGMFEYSAQGEIDLLIDRLGTLIGSD
ncbi:MAG: SCO family protein [Planctomycetota bacterium]